MTYPVETQHLEKIFPVRSSVKEIIQGKKRIKKVLHDISFHIEEGEIFGLLGPNGAGKTTLIKILSTLIIPTGGNVKIFGHDLKKDSHIIKSKIGLIHSDERSFFWRLTGRQNLNFFAAIFQLPPKTAKDRIEELLDLVGLEKDADREFHSYSTGMRQKLAIARGLLTRPKLLFMDEALRSIDPISTQRIRNFVKNDIYKLFQGTVILATNRLEEVSHLCHRVLVLNHGNLIACGTIDELKTIISEIVEYELKVKNLDSEMLQNACEDNDVKKIDVTVQKNGTSTVHLSLELNKEEHLHFVLKTIINSGGHIQRCMRIEPTLEEIFTNLVENSTMRIQGGNSA